MMQGVPIRVEIGPRDMANGKFVVVARDTGEKVSVDIVKSVEYIQDSLDKLQRRLFTR